MTAFLERFWIPVFIIALLLWTYVASDWYVCAIFNKCTSNTPSLPTIEAPTIAQETTLEKAPFKKEVPKPDSKESFKIENENIFFKTGASHPNQSLVIQNYLKEVAGRFKSGKIDSIKVVGHTDNQGNSAFNTQLGQQRAGTIRQMLVNYGVPEDKVIAHSEGPRSPLESNETIEGRAKNRRVQLIFNQTKTQ